MSKYGAGDTVRVKAVSKLKNTVSLLGGHIYTDEIRHPNGSQFIGEMYVEAGKLIVLEEDDLAHTMYEYQYGSYLYADWMLE